MATSTVISQNELQRIAQLAYEGETLNVMLCAPVLPVPTENSTIAEWQATEVSGNGYVRHSEIIQPGIYNSTTNKYEIPVINAEFTCDFTVYGYTRVVIYIEGAVYPHSIIKEDPNITLSEGQTQTYRINLNIGD